MLTRLGLRTFATTSLEVFNNVAKQQFMTTYRGGGINPWDKYDNYYLNVLCSYPVIIVTAEATIEYALSGRTIEFITTTVPEQFQGKGVGKLLAEHAFDHAKRKKLNVVIKCHFLENYYIKNKSKYEDLNVKIDTTE